MRPLLLTACLLTACVSTGGSFFEDPDPEPTPPIEEPTPGDDARMGWVQIERSQALGGGPALRATASFHAPAEYALWPVEATELDECVRGEASIEDWILPPSDLDVGTPSLLLAKEDLALDYDGTWWSRQLSTSYWEPNQEFTLRLSGGPDLPANFFEAVIGTPATLTLDEFAEGPDGLSLAWSNPTGDGDVRVLFSRDDQPEDWLYCRFDDDGEQLMPWSELEGVLPEGDYTVEVRRQSSADFALGEYPGTAFGLSSATADLFVRAPSRDGAGGP
jgi:hypothetical protein